MGILKEVNSNGNMLDLVNNVAINIQFYMRHREELADIGLSNEFLTDYLNKLHYISDNFGSSNIPEWFKKYNINKILSSEFPYVMSYLGFTWSLYDLVKLVCDADIYKENNNILDICPINSSVALVIFNTNDEFNQKKYLTKDEVKEMNVLS